MYKQILQKEKLDAFLQNRPLFTTSIIPPLWKDIDYQLELRSKQLPEKKRKQIDKYCGRYLLDMRKH